MDVWFVWSPIPTLKKQMADIVFSGHQDNPEAANIGVYSVLANKATEEYFWLCIEMFQQALEIHDQVIMQQMYRFAQQIKANQTLEFPPGFKGQTKQLKVPTIQYPITDARFQAYQIAANVLPLPSKDTFAIHTLCGAPLQDPHRKKMIAKELMAWYGAGNYYHGNQYLWLDGHVWNGWSMAMTWPGIHPHDTYHDYKLMQWMVATMVALAHQTHHIWVMPKVLFDHGIHFIWTMLDMQSIEEMVRRIFP